MQSFNENDELDLTGVLEDIHKIDDEMEEAMKNSHASTFQAASSGNRKRPRMSMGGIKNVESMTHLVDLGAGGDDDGPQFSAQELCRLFLEQIKAAYQRQVKHGELLERDVTLLALQESLSGLLNVWIAASL